MGALGLMIAGSVLGSTGLTLAVIAFFSSLAGVLRYRLLLIGSMLAAGAALFLVTGWLLTDPGTSKGDAFKTGGLASGAILALYALWINDRRRRTEEARHQVERGRAQQDRDRIDDERFAKAVEMLGHEADQVRVGALHALAGLARSRHTYAQTVLDVLCSYLRRPFTHPSYETDPDNPSKAVVEFGDTWSAEQVATADREKQVRLTAQRLIATLLPTVDSAEPVLYDLDLTGANLEYLDLSGRHIGQLTARRMRLHGASDLANVRIHRLALFTDAVFHSRTDLYKAHFDGGLSLLRARIDGLWRVPHATVRSMVDLRTTAPQKQTGELTVLSGTKVKVSENHGWAIRHADLADGRSLGASDASS